MTERRVAKERRAPFFLDEAKFSTQKVVTYALLLMFTGVCANVLMGADQAERSMVLQTIINFTMMAIGFWLGTSKGEVDKAASMSRIAEASQPNAAAAATDAQPERRST